MAERGNTDPRQITDGGGDSDEADNIDEGQIKVRDFYWDSIILYLVSVILALAAVDALIEFIRGSQVSCITNEGEDAKDYIVNFCSSSLPISQYVPAFIFIHGLAISIPHYLWAANSSGQFESFLSVVKSLDRFREEDTGKYSKKNFNLIRQLERSFTTYGRNSIFYLYIGKLFLQLCFSVVSLVISLVFFTDFEPVFHCPRDNNTDDEFWPLETQVTCVFQSLQLLYWIRLLDVIILIFVILAVILAFWFCASGHPNELGADRVGRFTFESGLRPGYYISSSPHCPRCFAVLTRYISSPFVSPRISTDLDFLLLKLFSSSASLAQVFRDVQTDLIVQLLSDDDYLTTRRHKTKWFSESDRELELPVGDLKWKFNTKPKPAHSGKEDITLMVPGSLRGTVLGLSSLSLLPDKKTIRKQPYHGALVITFNRCGLALGLARVFRKVGSICFTEFKRTVEEEGGLLEKLIDVEPQLSGVVEVTAPENILISKRDLSAMVHTRLDPIWKIAGSKVVKTSFLVVGPMTERQATRISLFLDRLASAVFRDEQSNITMSYLREGCVLVTLRPVTISGRNVEKEFFGLRKRIPHFKQVPLRLRVSNEENKWPPEEWVPPTGPTNVLEEEGESVPMTTVNPQTKLDIESEVISIVQTLTCGKVRTTFEIDVFKYKPPKVDSGLSTTEKAMGGLEGTKKAGLEDIKIETEGSKGVPKTMLLEKTPNEEQAKMGQSQAVAGSQL